MKEDPKPSELMELLTSDSGETESEVSMSQGSPSNHQLDSEYKTEEKGRGDLGSCNLSANSLEKKLSVKNEETKTLDRVSLFFKQPSSIKQLSLKNRKRKHHRVVITSPEDENPSNKYLKSSDIISSSSPKKTIKIESTCLKGNELTNEDLDILTGYTSVEHTPRQPKLSDLDDHFYQVQQTKEECSEENNLVDGSPVHRNVSIEQTLSAKMFIEESSKKFSDCIPEKSVLVKSIACLPDSPSFSPRKSNPTCFSPLLEKSTSYSESKGTGSLVVDTSLPLFSTPIQEKDGGLREASLGLPLSKELTKRVLFPTSHEGRLMSSPSACTVDHMPKAIPNQDIDEEYGFKGGINLSDLLDQSSLISEPEVFPKSSSSDLNRYLVLEKVSQMSTDCAAEIISSIRYTGVYELILTITNPSLDMYVSVFPLV